MEYDSSETVVGDDPGFEVAARGSAAAGSSDAAEEGRDRRRESVQPLERAAYVDRSERSTGGVADSGAEPERVRSSRVACGGQSEGEVWDEPESLWATGVFESHERVIGEAV
jgi:hypothetical protein